MKYLIYIITCFIIMCSLNSVVGFEDDFQNHPGDDPEMGGDNSLWNVDTSGTGTATIILDTTSGYTYNEIFSLYALGGGSNGAVKTTNVYKDESGYWSFIVKQYAVSYHSNSYLRFYDYQGALLKELDMELYFGTFNGNKYAEIVISSGGIYLYKDGVLFGNMGTISDNPAYIEFHGAAWYNTANYIYIKIDDISTDGFVVDIGTSENPSEWINVNSNDLINVGWTVKTIDPYGNWNDSTYQMITTWMDADQVVNTTTLDMSKPFGLVNYSRADLMPVPNYGTYSFTLTKDGTNMQTEYITFLPIGDSGSVYWDKSSYVPYEIASATFQYGSYTPATHNYYLKTYNINTGLKDTQTLTAVSGIVDVMLGGWETGSYYSLLTVKDKSTGNEYSLAFDTFDVKEAALINGVTYDVTNNVTLENTYVNFTQSTAWYNTTSNVNGSYELTDMSSGIQVTANASKVNYTHEAFLFTPATAAAYNIDLYLFPNNITRHTHAVEGVIIDDAIYQAIPGAAVNIWNSTWSNNTVANSLGYYKFDDLWCNSTDVDNETFNSGALDVWVGLGNDSIIIGSQVVTPTDSSTPYTNNTDYLMNYTDGKIYIISTGSMIASTDYDVNYSYYLPTTYYINATADGHDGSIDYTAIVNSWTVQNIPLRAIYSLNVTAVDAATGAKIQEFTVVVDSESRDIINGATTYYKNYGLYTVTISSEGYYSAQENTMMDRNRDVQLSLLPVDSEYYVAHYVEFIVCSIWGTKYPGVSVNVYNSTDTSGTSLLNGTTGTDGGVTFRMDQNIRYTMVFTGGGITEKTLNIYPKNERYYIIVSYTGDTFDDDTLESNIIGISVKHYPGVNGSVDVSYNDISDGTTALNFTIKERQLMGNFTTIATYDSFANMSNGDHRFILTDYSDKEYIVIVNYTHSEYGERGRNFGLSYGNNIAVLNAIFGPFIKGMLSVFILICVALIFGAANRETGALLVSLTAAIMHSMHWFDYFGMSTIILWAAISLALIVSISASFSKKSKEEGY